MAALHIFELTHLIEIIRESEAVGAKPFRRLKSLLFGIAHSGEINDELCRVSVCCREGRYLKQVRIR